MQACWLPGFHTGHVRRVLRTVDASPSVRHKWARLELGDSTRGLVPFSSASRYGMLGRIPLVPASWSFIPSGELAAPTNDINVTTFAGFVEYKGRYPGKYLTPVALSRDWNGCILPSYRSHWLVLGRWLCMFTLWAIADALVRLSGFQTGAVSGEGGLFPS